MQLSKATYLRELEDLDRGLERALHGRAQDRDRLGDWDEKLQGFDPVFERHDDEARLVRGAQDVSKLAMGVGARKSKAVRARRRLELSAGAVLPRAPVASALCLRLTPARTGRTSFSPLAHDVGVELGPMQHGQTGMVQRISIATFARLA
jgi:hypothetical protein